MEEVMMEVVMEEVMVARQCLIYLEMEEGEVEEKTEHHQRNSYH